MMMIYDNMTKLKDEHFSLLERLYNKSKDELLKIPESELSDLLFPEGDSPLWDAMLEFDENNAPIPDTLIAEQICDILRPPDVFRPHDDDDAPAETAKQAESVAA